MMNTQLQFLSDSFQFETEATVTGGGEDDDGPYVVTNRSVFYPGGGGQEPDKGWIITASGVHFPILKAKRKGAELWHYLDSALPVESSIKIAIDSNYRLQNTRLHTAGHLLASVIYEKLGWPLRPVKGFHYQQGAYVEFEPEEEVNKLSEAELNHAVLEDIGCKLAIGTAISSLDAVDHTAVLMPEDFSLPEDKPLRLVKIGHYKAVPCCGTHLHHIGEIGSFSVKQIRHNKGRIRVSYRAGEEYD